MFNIDRDNEIICALATPVGTGGIGVVRVCGEKAKKTLESLCSFLPDQPESHKAYFGNFIWNEEIIDEVVVTFFAKNHSYTGDETIEISCHGGPIIYSKILKALVSNGIRPAERGEFTYRAFINGRIDLVQAESVLALIESQSEKAASMAMRQLKGSLSKNIEEVTDELTWVLAHLEANIDFAHEDIEVASEAILLQKMQMVEHRIEDFLKSYKKGQVLKEGLSVALVGRPNVGKSSLLNQLLEEERSIVTDQPGTTRDFIESTLMVDGVKVNFLDTAGLRETKDIVEQKGIEKTYNILKEADLKIFILDLSCDFDSSELEEIKKYPSESVVVLGNKSDSKVWSLSQLEVECGKKIEVSALSKDGIKDFELFLKDLVQNHNCDDSAVISQARHYDLLKKALVAVQKSRNELTIQSSPEFVISELQEALFMTHEILGRKFDDEVMDRVFREFCLGK